MGRYSAGGDGQAWAETGAGEDRVLVGDRDMVTDKGLGGTGGSKGGTGR